MAIVKMTLDQIKKLPVHSEELERVNAITDEQINVADIPPPSENARIVSLFKPVKEQVTVRLDSDILAWLKKDGKGYQTRINNLLRQAMLRKMR